MTNSLKNLLLVVALLFSAVPSFARDLSLDTFVKLGKKLNPAVVNISTTQIISRRGGARFVDPFDPFGQFFAPRQPVQRKASSLGTGFIIESDGLIITNYHVIKNATEIQVQLSKEKKTYKARVIGHDERTDIALIKADVGRTLPTAKLGNSDVVEVGEWVAAFGNPYGHGHTMTKGIVSAKGRDIPTPTANYFPYIQTDASINPGNSGGPLVNTDGEVIGVNTMIDPRAQNIGFAIPINVVKRYIPELKSKGSVTRGFLGINFSPINEEIAKQMKLKTTKGVIVLDVGPKSPAKRAGIKPYDVIVGINGKAVEGGNDVIKGVAETPIGKKVKLKIVRNGRTLNLSAKVTTRKNLVAQNQRPQRKNVVGKEAPHKIGFRLAPLTKNLKKRLRLSGPVPKGPVIVGVLTDSVADQAGLQIGDIVLDVNKRRTASVDRAFKALKKGTNVLRIFRGGSVVLVFMDAK